MHMGRTNGLNDNDNGHMGTIIIEQTSFWIMGPPADRLYAVDPLGVDMIKPSINALLLYTTQ